MMLCVCFSRAYRDSMYILFVSSSRSLRKLATEVISSAVDRLKGLFAEYNVRTR